MQEFGFEVKTKEVKFIRTGVKRVIGKGNLDIELALDMTHRLRSYDTAILLSGDSDFEPAVRFVQEKGKKAIVISSRGHISRELARRADKYVPFEALRKYFERKNHPALRRGKSSV